MSFFADAGVYHLLWDFPQTTNRVVPCTRNTMRRECKCICWHSDIILQAHAACLSDCTLHVQTKGGTLLKYDFFPLSNITGFLSSPRFTSKGLQYFHQFNLGLCRAEVRKLRSWKMFVFFLFNVHVTSMCATYRVKHRPPVWTMWQRMGEWSEATSVSPLWSTLTSGVRKWCPPSLTSSVTHSLVWTQSVLVYFCNCSVIITKLNKWTAHFVQPKVDTFGQACGALKCYHTEQKKVGLSVKFNINLVVELF